MKTIETIAHLTPSEALGKEAIGNAWDVLRAYTGKIDAPED
jgi:hypothetical protein